MILITGATGQLGRVVIEHLVRQGDPGRVAALVRDEGKAADLKARGVDVRVGDYNDVASLDGAMRGVEQVLLISGTDLENVVRQHGNVVDAARRAGVRSIAFTGRARRGPGVPNSHLMATHFQTEELVRASGLGYALFRNALYMDTLRFFIGTREGFETDIRLPAGRGKVAYALRSELGEAIANALLQRNSEDRVYTLTGGEAWSFDDVAQALGELSGRPVTYTPIDKTEFEARMHERGLAEPMIGMVHEFHRDIGDGQLDEVTPDLEVLLGRKPASLAAGLKALFKL